MIPKERVIAALEHREPDRVPTGENAVDYELVEAILGRTTLYNARWREYQALWDGRRDEIVADYSRTHIELVRALEWDYVRVPAVPAAGEYTRPTMTGPYSWLDARGREVHYQPDAGNISTYTHTTDLTIDDLPDPDEDFRVDPSSWRPCARWWPNWARRTLSSGARRSTAPFPFSPRSAWKSSCCAW